MSHTSRVTTNSIWLIIQPLFLNFISLFVIGYIARTLGQSDYGKFTFAFAFIAIFMPLINMGLGSLVTREIAENRQNVGLYLGKLLSLRIALSITAFVLIVAVINIMNYPLDTRLVVYIAGLTILSYGIIVTFNSAFQGLEEMKYMAYGQFISGFILTVLSVVVLLIGFRLKGLTAVYSLGSYIGMFASLYYMSKLIKLPRLEFDFAFWKKNLARGFPFFIPGLIMMLGTKTGVIMLSKMAGDNSVGLFGAASSLVDRMMVIPDGVCTAIFPTIAALYATSRQDAAGLFEKFFLFLFLLGLPIAVGTTMLSKPIILLIYGSQFLKSAYVLQLLIWCLFFTFINSIMNWSLGAIHQEKKGLKISLVSAAAYILLCLFLIPLFREGGLAIASLASCVVTFVISYTYIRKYLWEKILMKGSYIKIILVSLLMGLCIYPFINRSIFISIPVGIAAYFILILLFRVISTEDILKNINIMLGKSKLIEPQNE